MVHVFSAMRPKQWLKNVFVFAPIPFVLFSKPEKIIILFVVYIAFCFAASSVYLINDVCDRDKDRLHPKKCKRAIASGRVSVRKALISSLLLMIVSLCIGITVNPTTFFLIAVYLGVAHLYTLFGKHIAFVDVLFVGSLYSIRALTGFAAATLWPNYFWAWCLLAGLIAIIVELGKRKSEVQSMGNVAETRVTLEFYSPRNLAITYVVVTSLVAIMYFLTSLSVSPSFIFSTALVVIGISRFWSNIGQLTTDVHPQEVILGDKVLLFTLGLFAVYFTAVVWTSQITR